MKNTLKIFFIILAPLLIISGFWYWRNPSFSGVKTVQDKKITSDQNPVVPSQDSGQDEAVSKDSNKAVEQVETQNQSDENRAEIASTINLQVPFVVQAPFANWSDPIFQNACEEASMLMAMGWVSGKLSILPAKAQTDIIDLADFEDKNLGYNADTNLVDMKYVFENYFHYSKISISQNISTRNIKDELRKGNLVLVPAFGQALKNPNYTAPGPVAHMLVITGYDPQSGEFITNDPGTKRGEGYRYKEDILFGAIWGYPSGKGPLEPPKEGDFTKPMLVVSR